MGTTFFRFVTIHVCDRRTDRQMERRTNGLSDISLTARLLLHSCETHDVILNCRYIGRLNITARHISYVRFAVPFQRPNGIVFVAGTHGMCRYFQLNFFLIFNCRL